MSANDFYPIPNKIKFCDTFSMDADAFVSRLRAHLDTHDDLTPAGLAHRAGIDNSTIRKLLSGENVSPRIATAEKICAALGTTLQAFMTDQNDKVAAEIVDVYSRLSPAERQMLLAAARGMIAVRREE